MFLAGKHGDVGDVSVQCRVATQHKHSPKLQDGHIFFQLVLHQWHAALQGYCPVGEDLDCAPVQLYEGLGPLFLHAGLHIGPVHSVSSLGSNSGGDRDDPQKVVELGILLKVGDLVHSLGGRNSKFVASRLQHSGAIAVIREVVVKEGEECEMAVPEGTWNSL
jgi:hypothetical protein